jgi:hypothetical protein
MMIEASKGWLMIRAPAGSGGSLAPGGNNASNANQRLAD